MPASQRPGNFAQISSSDGQRVYDWRYRGGPMDLRYLVVLSGILALIMPGPVAAAGQETVWTPPKTPWGDPDLMGTYTNRTITPVQRPDDLAGREFLTADEIVELERERIELNERLLHAPPERTVAGGLPRGGCNVGFYNDFWLDLRTKPTGRTSIIVDPPDGRLPPVTPEYERFAAARAEERLTRGVADTWTDLQLNARCIVWRVGPPMMSGAYNNTSMIFQTPDYVAIYVEMIHDARIIPLDGRPHLPSNIRQYLGDMRGHWEGDTLVIETTNIKRIEGNPAEQRADQFKLRASNGRTDDTIRVVERLTRVDADTINYQFTVEDSSRWTRRFSGELPFVKTDENIYEYACHEGNYSMTNILAGERALEIGAASTRN